MNDKLIKTTCWDTTNKYCWIETYSPFMPAMLCMCCGGKKMTRLFCYRNNICIDMIKNFSDYFGYRRYETVKSTTLRLCSIKTNTNRVSLSPQSWYTCTNAHTHTHTHTPEWVHHFLRIACQSPTQTFFPSSILEYFHLHLSELFYAICVN